MDQPEPESIPHPHPSDEIRELHRASFGVESVSDSCREGWGDGEGDEVTEVMEKKRRNGGQYSRRRDGSEGG